MNTYELNTVSIDLDRGDVLALRDTNSKAYLDCFRHILMFGRNIQIADELIYDGSEDKYYKNTKVVFSSPFSFSNLNLTDLNFETKVYSTTSQSVAEFGDKPYPVKGLTACIMTKTASDVAEIRANMDNFTRFTFNTDGSVYDVYVGILNNSQTEFYTPFKDLDSTTRKVFFDYNQVSQSVTAQTSLNNLVSSGSSSAMTKALSKSDAVKFKI